MKLFKTIIATTVIYFTLQTSLFAENRECNSEPYLIDTSEFHTTTLTKRNSIIKSLASYNWKITSFSKNRITALYKDNNSICIKILENSIALMYLKSGGNNVIQTMGAGGKNNKNRKYKRWFKSLEKSILKNQETYYYLKKSENIANLK